MGTLSLLGQITLPYTWLFIHSSGGMATCELTQEFGSLLGPCHCNPLCQPKTIPLSPFIVESALSLFALKASVENQV